LKVVSVQFSVLGLKSKNSFQLSVFSAQSEVEEPLLFSLVTDY